MTEAEVKAFLAQFDKAREDFKNWPKWMQDAAVERAATFPRTAGGAASDADLPEWVPVDVRMPRHGQRIIGRSQSGMWTETHDASEPLGHMTHWMPMERPTSGVALPAKDQPD
jgi:hypothetical protein